MRNFINRIESKNDYVNLLYAAIVYIILSMSFAFICNIAWGEDRVAMGWYGEKNDTFVVSDITADSLGFYSVEEAIQYVAMMQSKYNKELFKLQEEVESLREELTYIMKFISVLHDPNHPQKETLYDKYRRGEKDE